MTFHFNFFEDPLLFIKAVAAGNIQKVKENLKKTSINRSYPEYSDHTALSVAAYHGYLEIVRSLLGAGAEVDSDALVNPIRFGNLEMVKLLLSQKININEAFKRSPNAVFKKIPKDNAAKPLGKFPIIGKENLPLYFAISNLFSCEFKIDVEESPLKENKDSSNWDAILFVRLSIIELLLKCEIDWKIYNKDAVLELIRKPWGQDLTAQDQRKGIQKLSLERQEQINNIIKMIDPNAPSLSFNLDTSYVVSKPEGFSLSASLTNR